MGTYCTPAELSGMTAVVAPTKVRAILSQFGLDHLTDEVGSIITDMSQVWASGDLSAHPWTEFKRVA